MQTKDVAVLGTGYGEVVALYDGIRLVQQLRFDQRPAPLDANLAATFNSQRYCQVVARTIPNLYRLVDETKEPNPGQLQLPQGQRAAYYLLRSRDPRGAWMSPLRPTFLQEYRSYAGIKPEWNLAHAIVECALRPGAVAYVGRAGLQFDQQRRRLLTGGAVQVWLPASQFHHLSFTCWWIPQ